MPLAFGNCLYPCQQQKKNDSPIGLAYRQAHGKKRRKIVGHSTRIAASFAHTPLPLSLLPCRPGCPTREWVSPPYSAHGTKVPYLPSIMSTTVVVAVSLCRPGHPIRHEALLTHTTMVCTPRPGTESSAILLPMPQQRDGRHCSRYAPRGPMLP